MPPKIKFTAEQIVEKSLEIIKCEGIQNLNSRNLANSLGCSVHPIFRVFNTMEELKITVCQEVLKKYNNMMLANLDHETENPFFNMGLAYIRFAQQEKEYFKLLFMTDIYKDKNIMEIAGSTEGDDQVIELLVKMTGLDAGKAQILYTGVWVSTHGIASLYATNQCKIKNDDIKTLLFNIFNGLLLQLKGEKL